ncbi:MAG: methyl-accepting chemotaxis protein [Xanthomonadaceae bacterium]|nr:methyl-accepting chemotaxis protein [Xanthomonadaceae bacterium]
MNYLLLLSTADNMIGPLYSGDLTKTNSALNFANKLIEFDPTILPDNIRDTAIDANEIFTALSENREEISNFIKEGVLTIEKTRTAIKAEEANELAPGSSLNDQIADIKDSSQNTIYALAGLSALLLLLILIIIFRVLNARKNDSFNAARQNKKNEEAIMEMLNAMMKLSEGDLTVQAKVSDNITGTLADSFNVSVEELRALVAAVNASSDNLSTSVTNTTEFVDNYTEAALSQANQISEAADTVSHVVQAMLDVSAQTSAAVDIAMSSTEVARSGSERVRSTITGMDQIREHIQETSKRIKRLGESSQEIGDVVELINDIADQTHILALNAAIQASVAGEAGKGFAVVADEVQRLAERTGNATQRVEDLVKTIQTDTNEAIFAMEKSTSEVVNGANLAERAGESLNEIESVSGRLAALIQSVSQASREVSELGSKVKSSMDSVKEISEESVNNTKTTKSSIDHILTLANELKSSVAGFKID